MTHDVTTHVQCRVVKPGAHEAWMSHAPAAQQDGTLVLEDLCCHPWRTLCWSPGLERFNPLLMHCRGRLLTH